MVLRTATGGPRMAFSPNSISRDSHNGTPSHSCLFWQPSCASCWSAPDGPKRLSERRLRKRSGGPPADCDLRPAACGLRMAFSPNSISRDSLNGTPSHSCPFWQPSCASCWSAPDGPKRLTGRPLRKRSSGPPRFGRRGGKIVASGSWLVGRPLLTANC